MFAKCQGQGGASSGVGGEITFKFRLRGLEGRVPHAEEVAWRMSLAGASQVALRVKKLPASVGSTETRV